jgi:hypothetical protein
MTAPRPRRRCGIPAADSVPLRLLAISSRKFVSGDGNMTMEFSRGNDDDDMTLRYVPGRGLAEVVATSASFAQR